MTLLVLAACENSPVDTAQPVATPALIEGDRAPTGPPSEAAIRVDDDVTLLGPNRKKIGAITWERAGRARYGHAEELAELARPFAATAEPEDAGFPARMIGARMYSAGGDMWVAVGFDEELAHDNLVDYLGYDPDVAFDPSAPIMWGAPLDFEAIAADPANAPRPPAFYDPEPTEGEYVREAGEYNDVYCDYTPNYGSSMDSGFPISQTKFNELQVSNPNDRVLGRKHVLRAATEGGEVVSPLSGDALYSTSEQAPVVLLRIGLVSAALPVYDVSPGGAVNTTFHGWQLRSQANCSGTLISDSVVLTAAHCLEIEAGALVGNLDFISVCTDGSMKDATPVQCRPVENTFIAPGYVHNFPGSDWAMVKVAAPFTGITPMQLYGVNPQYFVDHNVSVNIAGYPGVPHGVGEAQMCATKNGMFTAKSIGFWDSSSTFNSYSNNEYSSTMPGLWALHSRTQRWVGMSMNATPDGVQSVWQEPWNPNPPIVPLSWGGHQQHKSTGEIKSINTKTLHMRLTHGGGYSGSPYYAGTRYIVGVHSMHYALSLTGSAAGPRVSYWLYDMNAARNGI